MKNKRIEKLKQYKNILLQLKRIQIVNLLDQKIEGKMPTYKSSKSKVLVLKKDK